MTEKRMDRARRIREMRERGRQDTDSDGETEARTTDGDGTGERSEEEGSETSNQEEPETPEQEKPETPEQEKPETPEQKDTGETPTEDGVDGVPEKERQDETVEQTLDGTGAAESTEPADSDDDEQVTPSIGNSSGIHAPLPEADELEVALDGTDAETETKTAAQDVESSEESETQVETRVLEFTLEDEYYCLNIEYIEEIVKDETVTRVPNTPAFVEGVVDLRGQITTILNPKVSLEKENHEPGDLIIVFDSEAFDDQGYIGWVVDDVRQVSLITDADVNQPPLQEDYINGVIDSDDNGEFVIWTTPDLALTGAE